VGGDATLYSETDTLGDRLDLAALRASAPDLLHGDAGATLEPVQPEEAAEAALASFERDMTKRRRGTVTSAIPGSDSMEPMARVLGIFGQVKIHSVRVRVRVILVWHLWPGKDLAIPRCKTDKLKDRSKRKIEESLECGREEILRWVGGNIAFEAEIW
jgi:hypothetical protein